jgi:hypothetical protein
MVANSKGCWTHGRTHGQTHTVHSRTHGWTYGQTHCSAEHMDRHAVQQNTCTDTLFSRTHGQTHCSAEHMYRHTVQQNTCTDTLFSRTHGQTHCSQPHPLTFGSGYKLWWSNARALGKPCHPHCIRHNNSAASTGAKLGVNNTRDLQVIHTKKGKERKHICGTVRTSAQNQSVRTRTDEDDSDFNTRNLQVMQLVCGLLCGLFCSPRPFGT